jgi:serine/threonine-protein kinase
VQHAAHEARDERGTPLGIVHRDVSPQNIIVGVDGIPRVLDFGVAKAVGRLQTTRDGQLKGKIAYMAPEQIGGTVDRTTDVYAASVVLWEALTGKRLFQGDSEVEAMKRVLAGCSQPPSAFISDIPPDLDAITMRGLDRDPAKRFPTAGEMAFALEEALPLVAASRIGRWVQQTAQQRIAVRAERIAVMESNSAIRMPRPPHPSGATYEPVLTPVSGSRVVQGAPVLPVHQLTGPGGARAVRQPAWGLVIAIGAMLLTIAAAVGGVLGWTRLHHRAAVQPVAPAFEPVSSIPASTVSSEPSEQPAEITPPPVASEPPPSVPITALPSATAARSAPPSVNPVRPTASAAKSAATARPAADCTPPYYFNAQGDRIFKQECL